MEPTRPPSQRSTIGDLPSHILSPTPEASIEDLDAPAYTRGLTPLPELQEREAMQAADREDASNRSFNRQFWFTLASEVGGVPTGMSTARLAEWVTGILGRQKPGGAPTPHADGHKW
jgi:hypothetical protein